MNDEPTDKRVFCRVNGHTWSYVGDEFGQYPDGSPTIFEVYICSVCDRVNYEPVAD